MTDRKGQTLNVGDYVRIGQLSTPVEGFKNWHGEEMVVTHYGEFNRTIVEKELPQEGKGETK